MMNILISAKNDEHTKIAWNDKYSKISTNEEHTEFKTKTELKTKFRTE